MPTPLVDWLRAQDDVTLAELLRLRPDLAVPPPGDLGVLATRAAVRASVHRACDELDTVALAVLEALLVADADVRPVPRAELLRLLRPGVPAAPVDRALAALRARAIVWDSDLPPGAGVDGGVDAAPDAGADGAADGAATRRRRGSAATSTDRDPGVGLAVVPATRDVVPRYPGGLGRSSPGLAGSTALPELLAAVPADERRVLEALAAGPPIGRSRAGGDPDSPVGRLLARGLLLRVDADTVELPRQVGLALRGDRPLGTVALIPPQPATRNRGEGVVDATAGGAAMELLRRADRAIAFWGESPPPVLRSGGLGVRDLRRLAREIDADERVAGLLVEILAGADLVAETDGAGAEWLPTTAADVWSVGGPEHRWVLLARSWLDLPRLPGLIGSRDEAGRALGPLTDAVRRPLAPRDRRRVLAGLAELPPGTAVESPGALADVLAWRAPRRGGRLRDELVAWTLAEATVLGVVALDALATPGRALLADPGSAAVALRAVLPEPVDHVLLQADLTAVAPGPLEASLARELGLLADVESAGGATVYRFTETSVRRALDAGRSAADVHELLAARSATPVPQALTYLVDDVARRHGRLRGGAATSFLRSDDDVLLSEVLAHPVAQGVELRRLAPTVAVSPVPLAELLDRLREAGFSPAAEDPGGGVLDLSERGRARRRGAVRPAGRCDRAGRRPAGGARRADAGGRRHRRGAPRGHHGPQQHGHHVGHPASGRGAAAQRLDRFRRRARRRR